MSWLRHLRWKLFVSHVLVILIGVIVLLLTAHFLAGTPLVQETSLSLGSAASETGQVQPPPDISMSQPERFQAVVDEALLIAAFAALATAIVISLFVSRRIVEPLQELTAVSRRLAHGYYHERTQIESDDELADLSRSINQLAATLEQTEHRRLALLADVAHELRTPLTTIEGYMEGLIDGVIAPNSSTFTLIQHEAVRLKRLIEELALLSRAEAGELPIVPRPLDVRPVINQVATQFLPLFSARHVALRVVLPNELAEVHADPDRVEQTLINLLSNALRYTPPNGSVTIEALPQEYYVQIGIHDTGVGIAGEHLSHIFERFYRVDKSRNRQSGGTGIGLTISRHLIYAQGGDIWAESDGPGKGASFYLTLPLNEIVAL
jgi:histidine kinase